MTVLPTVRRVVLGAPGRGLDDETWSDRHRRLLALLAVQAVAVAVWAAGKGLPAWHVLVDAGGIAALGALGAVPSLGRRARGCAVTLGLFTVSAVVVHLAEGAPEAHFHYFVMLACIATYEDVAPFGLGVAYVIVQHGLFGSLAPDAVFHDRAAEHDPWGLALVHGAFILAESVALIMVWRANESVRVAARVARDRERAERRRAEAYLGTAAALMVVLDRDARVVVANRRACELLDAAPDAVRGRSWADELLAAPLRAAARETVARALVAADGEVVRSESVLLGPDGPRTIEWHSTPLRDEEGRPAGVVHSGLDVTERRAAEHQLEEERRDLARLRDLARDVASLDDARDAIVRAARELTGAANASLAEVDADGRVLTVTAADGTDALVGKQIAIGREPSGAATAFVAGAPFFAADAASHPAVSRRIVEEAGIASILFHPIQSREGTLGTLAVGWTTPIAAPAERVSALVALVADEAAVALERHAHLRRLEAAALHDPLTGAANRRAWDLELERALARAARSGEPLAVALVDLNAFKALNDLRGHAAGDDVLARSVTAWQAELRISDLLARIGGDEFAVLLPDCDTANAQAVAARLKRACAHDGGCAVGVATWDAAEDAAGLLRRADRALYADKARDARTRLADAGRLAAVRAAGAFDGPDDELDHITEVVSWLLQVPTVLVTLVDDERQEFVSHCGLEGWPAEEGGTPLTHSFCQHTVTTGRPLVVPDARQDPLVAANAAVEDLGVVAYAGVPLLTRGGHALGALCAIDSRPRTWTEEQLRTLQTLAIRAAEALEARAARRPPV